MLSQKRADLLRQLREFFHDRGFLEVETPLVSDEVIPELHIEPLRLENGEFLQASPELAMKRLVGRGGPGHFSGDAFVSRRRARPACTIRSSRSSNGIASATTCTAGIDFVDEMMQYAARHAARRRERRMPRRSKRTLAINPHTASLEQLAGESEALAIGHGSQRPRRMAQRDSGKARRAAAWPRPAGDHLSLSGVASVAGARRRLAGWARSRRAIRALLSRRRTRQWLSRAHRRRGTTAPL